MPKKNPTLKEKEDAVEAICSELQVLIDCFRGIRENAVDTITANPKNYPNPQQDLESYLHREFNGAIDEIKTYNFPNIIFNKMFFCDCGYVGKKGCAICINKKKARKIFKF